MKFKADRTSDSQKPAPAEAHLPAIPSFDAPPLMKPKVSAEHGRHSLELGLTHEVLGRKETA